MLKVYDQCCNQCLLSKNRIVWAARAKEIINGCKQKQTYFVCHKASIDGETVVCKSFFDQFGEFSQLIRIAERLNAVQTIPQPYPVEK